MQGRVVFPDQAGWQFALGAALFQPAYEMRSAGAESIAMPAGRIECVAMVAQLQTLQTLPGDGMSCSRVTPFCWRYMRPIPATRRDVRGMRSARR